MNRRPLSLTLILIFIVLLSGCAIKQPATLENAPTQSQQISVYFPRAGQDPAPVLTGLYGGAKNTIDVGIYGLTHPDIVKALVDAHRRGVKVRIITDNESSGGNTQKHAIGTLTMAGVPVKLNSHSGLMHLKMSIVDGQTVTTGSYNYTKSASERNDEMLAVVRDPGFVGACQGEFDRMWNDGGFKAAK